MKRKLSFVLATALCASTLLSAVPAFAEEAAEEEKVVYADPTRVEPSDERFPEITVALNQTPTDLTPWNARQGGKEYFLPLIYDTLFIFDVFDTSLEEPYYPCLAKGYEVEDDTHYLVELNEGVFDTDGNPITADDVVFSYNNIVETGYAVKFNCYQGIEKVDDTHVRFTWNYPLNGVNELETVFCAVYIFSEKAAADHNLASEMCGSGPYKLDEYVGGSGLTVSAKEDYWQKDKEALHPYKYQNVQTIHYNIVTEASQNIVGLQTGTIDVSSLIPKENIADFEEGGSLAADFSLAKVPQNSVYFIMGNTAKGVTADENFRKAVYYALDEEQVALAAGNTLPLPQFGSINCKDALPVFAEKDDYMNVYDPAKAAEYLAQSGYNGETLSMMGFNTEVSKNAMTVIQLMLQAVGINVEINALEQNLVNSNLVAENEWDLLFYFVGGNPTINALNRVLNKTELGNDLAMGFIDDSELQSLYELTASKEGWNDENMEKLYDYIVEKGYLKTLFQEISTFAYSNKIATAYVWNNQNFVANACNYNM